MSRWLVSWQQPAGQGFDLIFPWWRGQEDVAGRHRITAAIIAPDVTAAREAVEAVQRGPDRVLWNMIAAKPDDWDPFTEDRPREDWMVWPKPGEVTHLRAVPEPAANDAIPEPVAMAVCKVEGCDRLGAVMMSSGGHVCWACLIEAYHSDAIGLMA